MHLTPDFGIPMPAADEPIPNLYTTVAAAAAVTDLLAGHGLYVEDDLPTADDEAATILAAYAADPNGMATKTAQREIGNLSAATVLQINAYLQEFAVPVIQSAVQIRHYVTNRLLIESQDNDPKIRIRALELLGKISDVSLFTEKVEKTVVHRTTDDLRASLREKLTRLSRPAILDVEDGVVIEQNNDQTAA